MKIEQTRITPNMNVEHVLSRWPQTVPVFIKYRMGCVGCTMASYETLSNAVEIYRLSLNRFIQDLQMAVDFEE